MMHRRTVLFAAAALGAAPAAFAEAPFATPRPSGAFAVGRVERAIPGMTRAALIHYPAHGATTPSPAARMPAAHADNLARRFGPVAAERLIAGAGYAQAGAVARPGRYPVLIFAPGLGLLAHDFRALLEDAASHGFVVVAISPDDEMNYGAIADRFSAARAAASAWSADGADRLGALMDTARVAAIGHSVGGAGAVLAAHRDAGFACALNLDGDYAGAAEQARPRQPILYLTSSDANEPQRSRDRRARVWRAVSAQSAAPTALRVASMAHFNFLDVALLAAVIPADRRTGRFGAIDAARGLALTSALIAAYCAEQLQGETGAFARARATMPEAAAF